MGKASNGPEIETLDDLLVPSTGKNRTQSAEHNIGHGKIYSPEEPQMMPSMEVSGACADADNPVLTKRLGTEGADYANHCKKLMEAISIQTKPVSVAFGTNKVEISADARDVPNAMHLDNNLRTVQIIKALLGDDLTKASFAVAARSGFRKKMGVWISQKLQEALKGFRVAVEREPEHEAWDENGADSDETSAQRKAIQMVFGPDNEERLVAAAKFANMSTVSALRTIVQNEVDRVNKSDADCIKAEVSELAGTGLE